MRRHAWKCWTICGAVVAAGSIALPGGTDQKLVYLVLGAAAVAAILVGTAIHCPEDPWSWYLLAAGTACFALGGAIQTSQVSLAVRAANTLSMGGAVYLAGYPLVVAGTLRLTRSPNRSARREANTDAAIIAVAGLAVWWQFLVDASIHDGTLTTAGRFLTLVYPVMDVLLIFIVFRALLCGRISQPCRTLLAVALVTMSVADFVGDLWIRYGHAATGPVIGAVFLLQFVLIGAAALHTSMAEVVMPNLEQPANIYRRENDGRHRVPVVAFAGFLPPSILLIAACLGADVDVAVMSGICIAAFALIYLRMMWLIGTITGQTSEIEVHARALEASLHQREALESDLRHLAFHDELTGLANRALLHDRVEQALASAQRTGQTLALCFGDLDGFKTVNDTLGHHVGDSVLVRASRLLSSIVRPGDTVARLGGDEFAVLMVDVGHPDNAVEFAHRVVSVLSDAPDFEGNQIGLSISVGVAYGEPGKTTEQLLSEADSAMYEAKETGKNRVEVFRTSMRSRMLERLDLTNGFRWALGRSEFFLEYQPIVSLADGHLAGFEALVRWNHPHLGHVEPLRFIPIAEETGFIVPLGRWVLVEACDQLAAWSAESGQTLTLSVNLSRRQLISPQLTDEIRTALTLSGMDPQQLMLEVTESVLMDDPAKATQALSELRSLGIRIAVDDFGTGYSSLSHLQRFPVDVLKIDKSFIDPLARHDEESMALVTAILGLAGTLGLQVIAEGIEHPSQLQRLIELGCDRGQGFLMARPLDAEGAVHFINQAHQGVSVG